MYGDPSDVPGRGSRLGKYRLIAPLGAGGMAEVFLAASEGSAGFVNGVLDRIASDLGKE